MIVAVARLRESANNSLCDSKAISVDAKISLNVRRRVVSPSHRRSSDLAPELQSSVRPDENCKQSQQLQVRLGLRLGPRFR